MTLLGLILVLAQAAEPGGGVSLVAVGGIVGVTVAVVTAGSGILWKSAFEAQKARSTTLAEDVDALTKKLDASDTACERKLVEMKHEHEVQMAEMRGHVNALEGRLGDRLVEAIERSNR